MSSRHTHRSALRHVPWHIPATVVLGGVFIAWTSPHQALPWMWVVAFVPLFLGLDFALTHAPAGLKAQLWRTFAATYPAGVIFAAITGDWVTNTANVYGALPLPLAFAANALGYGSLFGLELFAFLGIPFALTRRRPVWALAIVPLWCTVGQVYVPRFLFFTYGQVMLTTPALVQFADVLGSGGLNLLYLPLQLLLALGVRRMLAKRHVLLPPMPGRTFAIAAGIVMVLFAAAFGYGLVQMEAWARAEAAGPKVEVVGIQPNFSLGHLASNPALSHSDRKNSIQALVSDSEKALAHAAKLPGIPTVLLWPESVYPRPYFYDGPLRDAVERWVRRHQVQLVLATQDAEYVDNGHGGTDVLAFGAAVHLGAEGMVRGVYHKIALIPFGETIPFSSWFPAWARFLRSWIPQISEFTPGTEYTVFALPGDVGLAPMICFDVANESVARGMARNGARLGVVLANLAWFGPTTVSDQLSWFARFRAIENRMPLVFLSQNGESFLVDAGGTIISRHLPQFDKGAIIQTLGTPEGVPFFTRYGSQVHAAYALGLLVLLILFPGRAGWRGLPSRVRQRLTRRSTP